MEGRMLATWNVFGNRALVLLAAIGLSGCFAPEASLEFSAIPADSVDTSSIAASTTVSALALSPTSTITTTGASVTFSASGGVAPRSFSVVSGGGSIDSSGVYTAPGAPGTATVKVTDAAGSSVSATVEFYTAFSVSPSGTQYLALNGTTTFTVTGGYGSVVYGLDAGNVGSFNSGTGLYTAPAAPGTDVFRATDGLGNVITRTIVTYAPLTINPPPTVNVPVSGTTTFTTTGGAAPLTFSIVTGGIGSIDSSGVYTAPAGAGGATVKVTDAAGNFQTSQVLVYAPLTLNPSSAQLPWNGTRQFSSSGGVGALNWSVDGGGVGSVNGTGLYTAPGGAGVATVRVTDSIGTNLAATVTVYDPLWISPATNNLAPSGTVTLNAGGGYGALAFSLLAGSVGSIHPTTGVYTAPATPGAATAKVTDSLGNTRTASINVYGPLTLSPASGDVAVDGQFQFNALGGATPHSFSVIAGPGSVDATGRYTANGGVGAATIQVQDFLGSTQTSTMNVVATAYNLNCFGGVTATDTAGIMWDSGGEFGNYGDGQTCSALIQPAGGAATITLSFPQFGVDWCCGDRVKVYDGTSAAGIALHSGTGFMGQNSPWGQSFTAFSGAIYIEMQTDANWNQFGFKATWSSTPPAAPVANFTSPGGADIGQSITFTDTSSGTPTAWSWDFNGDGTPDSSAQNPTYSYSGAGEYAVRLTVANAGGSHSVTKKVFVGNFPMCKTTGSSAYSGQVFDSGGPFNNYGDNESCGFLIQPSGGTGMITLTFTNFGMDSTDNLKVYDGTNASGVPLHTSTGFTNWMLPPTLYATSGAMYLVFTSSFQWNANGFEASWTASPAGSPGANFTVSSGDAGVPITFSDTSSGSPTAWEWDFDGDTVVDSYLQNPVHTYAAGTHTVSLKVSDAFGSSTRYKTIKAGIFNMCETIAASAGASGTLYDSGGPANNYGSGENCAFLIQPVGTPGSITLNFSQVSLDFGADFVRVYEGVDATAPTLHPNNGVTGWLSPGPSFTSNAGAMYVVMSTDAMNTNNGFDATWTSSAPGTVGASFTAPAVVEVGTTVNFVNTSINSPTSHEWDFDGDGLIDSTAVNPSFTFTSAGERNVTLRVTKAGVTSVKTRKISVGVFKLCGAIASSVGAKGKLYDSGGPNEPYSNDSSCGFLIQPAGGPANIVLSFQGSFSLNDMPGAEDYVKVYDGTSNAAPQLHLGNGLTGWGLPGSLVATSGAMYVELISGPMWANDGFQASWSTEAPFADFTANPPVAVVGQNIQFTDTSTGSPTSWEWDFENDAVADSVSQNPSFSYGLTGTYTVKLKATNLVGFGQTTKTVEVVTPSTMCGTASSSALKGALFDSGGPGADYGINENCGFLIQPGGGSPIITLTFGINMQVGNGEVGDHVEVYDGVDDTGIPIHTGQGFGGGNNPPGPLVATSGSMYIKMITNGVGVQQGFDAYWVVAQGAPGANFTPSSYYVDAGQSITFTDSSVNSPTSWAWDLDGDGLFDSTQQNPSMSYPSPGVYAVRLRATNANGYSEKTRKVFIGMYLLCNPDADSSTNSTGTLYDSGGPNGNYGNQELCGFLIAPAGASSVTLTFNSFSLESGFETLRAYNGFNTAAPPLHPLAPTYFAGYAGWNGTLAPFSVTANSGVMFVEMFSEYCCTYPGFEATWTSSP